MRLVIQRVTEACVSVRGRIVSAIGPGAVILLGVAKGDTSHDALYLARKASQLRIFDDHEGKMNLPIDSVKGAFLVVSQFTLFGDCSKGNRPSYIEAAAPEDAQAMYELFARHLQTLGHEVKMGVFRENMTVNLANQGPVTLILESAGRQSD
ncbi:MAG: D-aminoacyl-tRNA deacylase [Lentisphaerota bacterium]